MSRPTVLLVEDDEATAYWVRKVLDTHVLHASDPLRIGHVRTLGEAIEQLARAPADCVLLDLVLPDSSGMETYVTLRDAAPSVPVVLLTALDDDELGAEAVRLGAQDYLPKGAAPEQIARAVRHAVLRARWQGAVAEAAQLESVLDSISDAYLAIDAEACVTYANRAAELLFGAERSEVVGRGVDEGLAALAGSRLRRELMRGVTAPGEFEEYLPALGRWVEVRLFPSHAGTTAYLRDASPRHQADRERFLHRQVLDTVSVGVTIAEVKPDGFPVRYVNPALERMTGYSADDFIQRGWTLIRGPETDPVALRRLTDAVAAEEALRLEIVYYRADGTRFWNDLAISPIYDPDGRVSHYIGIHQDITERRRTEEALREAQRATAALVRNLPGMAYRCANDAAWTMKFASEGALELTGYPAARLVEGSVHFNDLIHPDDRERVWNEVQAALVAGQPYELTYRITTADGAQKWVWEQGRTVPVGDGEGPGLEGFISDSTRQRTLEDQLRQAQKMDAVGRLAGGVAHDFNNLLTAIRGTASLMLLDLPPEDPLHADAREITVAVERAAALTRQLLAFGRGHAAKAEVVDLSRVVTDTGRMLRRLIDSGIELSTVLAPDLGSVRADPGQMEQVLVNLVLNARDAMPGGGTVVVETMNVTVDTWPENWATGLEPGQYVMLVVNDNGVGIDPLIQDRIFEPFFTTKELGKGSGLGLSIVYGIVQQSGGTIRVYSRPGIGTTFRVLLPRIADVAPVSEPPRPAPTIPRWSGTVLLVDDEPAVRRATRRMLERTGLTVFEAGNGEEALRWIREHHGPVDLLVTDVVMPLMGGAALAEHMATERPEMPVLFVSGYTEQNAFRDGAATEGRFLHKPFTWDALTEAVGKLLGVPR